MNIFSFFFPQGQPAAVVLNAIITVVGVMALVRLYLKGVRPLHGEAKALADVETCLKGDVSADVIIEAAQSVPPETLVAVRIDELARLRELGE